jgi:cytochrome P450
MTTQTHIRPPEAEPVTPPSPHGNWLLGNMRDFNDDPLGMLTRTAQMGRVTRLRFINATSFLAAHPDDVKHVLVDNHRAYHKGFGLQALKPVVGEGLLTSEEEVHTRQRRLIQPAFHRKRIEAYADTMVALTNAQIAPWQTGCSLDLHDEMMHLTMLIVAKSLFDADVEDSSDQLGKSITQLIEAYDMSRIGPIGQFIDKFDFKRNRARAQNLDVLDGMIYDLIRARRAEPEDRGDLLSMILNAVDSEAGAGHGQGMSDRQARDELVTLFLAGHETTAIALSWTFYLLSQNPDARRRLESELDGVLGAPGAGARLPTMDDLDRLPYTRRVFSEAMRLYPPAWATARLAQTDDLIGGVRVRKGDSVIVSQWVTHRDPQWWPEPARFEPDRFLPEVEATRPKFAYFPFGGGPRRCIGEPFAWMEGHLLLATIAHRMRLNLQPGFTPTLQPRVTLRPNAMPMRVEMRW